MSESHTPHTTHDTTPRTPHSTRDNPHKYIMDEDLKVHQYYYEQDIIRKESCHTDFEKIKLWCEKHPLIDHNPVIRHRIRDCESKLNELNHFEDIREGGMKIIEDCKIGGIYQRDEIIQTEIKRINEAHRGLIGIHMRKPIIRIPNIADINGLFAYYTKRIEQVQSGDAVGDIFLLQSRWNELKPRPIERYMKKIRYNQMMMERTIGEITKQEYLDFREMYHNQTLSPQCKEPLGYLNERKRKFYDRIQLIVYGLLPFELPSPLIMNIDPSDEIIQNKKRIEELWIEERAGTCTDPDKDPCILINALKYRNKILTGNQPQPPPFIPVSDRDQYVRDKLLQIFLIQRDKIGNANINHQKIQLLRYDIYMANKNDNITMDLSCVDEDHINPIDRIKYYEAEIEFLTILITRKNKKNGIIRSSIRPYQRKIKAFKYSILCYKQKLIQLADTELWEMPLAYDELFPGSDIIPIVKYHGFFSDATKFQSQLKKAKADGDNALSARLCDIRIGFNIQLKDWHVTLIFLNSYQFILQHISCDPLKIQVVKPNMIKSVLQSLK